MLFNSFEFFVFYFFVVIGFFSLPQRYRWVLLLCASIYFYMCWVPQYIVFLFFIILVDFCCGIGMQSTSELKRKLFFIISLFCNLGLLFVFKYFNFFAQNISAWIGYPVPLLQLLLPLGISFHVFQSLSYTIEVYRRRIEPEKHLGLFALYVLFFPQLVAGPIERPQNLLHQFREKKEILYSNFRSGIQLILWGLIKKVCIADLLAIPISNVFESPTLYSGPVLLLAAFYFTLQIYCDFSGYTDIARGAAKILGYDLMINFRQPYFSQSLKEFWQRWHISLSTWFRDYVYFPLGGSRGSQLNLFRNLFVVFMLSGLWHDAAWHFVVWGCLHGVCMIIQEVTSSARKQIVSLLKVESTFLHRFLNIFFTFNLIMVGWVFFRANNLDQAIYILKHMYIPARVNFSDISYGVGLNQFQTLTAWLSIFLLLVIDYFIAYKPQKIMQYWNQKKWRWMIYALGSYSLVFLGVWGQAQFIYFQF